MSRTEVHVEQGRAAAGSPEPTGRQRCNLRADACDDPHPPPTGRRLVPFARRELAPAAPGDCPRFRAEGRARLRTSDSASFAEAHARLSPDGDATAVDMLAWLQHLALDVASRALFSMPIGPFGTRLRQRIIGYGVRHSAAGFLDFFLPTSIPNPRD